MTTSDIWRYRDVTFTARNVAGYHVEALDGGIGKVDDATDDSAVSYLIVDTGPWIFGKKVMLPAGVIDRVDHDDEKIFVHRTKDEIKNAPEFDEARYRDDAYRGELGTYYGPKREGIPRVELIAGPQRQSGRRRRLQKEHVASPDRWAARATSETRFRSCGASLSGDEKVAPLERVRSGRR